MVTLSQCYTRDITGPGGYEAFSISMFNAFGTPVEHADFWIYVP